MTTRSKIILSVALMASVALVVFLRWEKEEAAIVPTAPIILLSPGYKIPFQGRSILDRVMPSGPSWAWLWKLRYALLGRTKVVHLDSTLFDFQNASKIMDGLPPDLTTPDGLQVWRLGAAQAGTWQKLLPMQIPVLSSSGIITGNNMEAGMFTGNPVLAKGVPQSVGLNINVLPSMRRDTLDLIAVYSFSEAITNRSSPQDISIRTNFEFAARIQLPLESGGILVVAPPPASPYQPRIGLLLTASPAQVKKKNSR